jgi:hypothetical protein
MADESSYTTPARSEAPQRFSSGVEAHENQRSRIVAPVANPGKQPERLPTERSGREIGLVIYDEDAQDRYRFRCDVEGCTTKDFGRVQELNRHLEDIHGNTLLVCGFGGWCMYSKSRRDKLIKHCREKHNTEYAG